ncbi:hypothetical protein Tco_0565889 [Tanacetum coccineum]
MPNTRSGASMTHGEIEDLIAHREEGENEWMEWMGMEMREEWRGHGYGPGWGKGRREEMEIEGMEEIGNGNIEME